MLWKSLFFFFLSEDIQCNGVYSIPLLCNLFPSSMSRITLEKLCKTLLLSVAWFVIVSYSYL